MTEIDHFCWSTLLRSRAKRLYEAYSPECVEYKFCELRLRASVNRLATFLT
jgi:hypothetical protein